MVGHFTSKKTAWIVVLAVCSAFITVAGANRAAAISNEAPDQSEYGAASGHTRLALTSTSGTKNVTTLRVPIYINAPASAQQSSLSAKVSLHSFFYPYGNSDTLSKGFRVWAVDSNGSGGICAKSNRTLTVDGFSWSSQYALWYTTIELRLVRDTQGSADNCRRSNGSVYSAYTGVNSDALIELKMKINNYTYRYEGNNYTVASNGSASTSGGNSWLAYSRPTESNADDSSYYFSTDARGRGSGYANYRLQFATPCNITRDTPATIYLDDLDSGHSDNGGGNISISIRDVTTNSNVAYTTGGSMGNNAEYRIRMTFQPGHRYQLRVNNIYYYNILKYRLPYDNISYVTRCPSNVSVASIGPALTISPSPSVRDGSDYSVAFNATTTGSLNGNARTSARIWYDRNRNGSFDGGDASVFYEPDGDRAVRRSSNGTVNLITQTRAADSALGDRICASWRISSFSQSGVTVSSATRTHCIDIVPLLTTNILGNDIRVGSSLMMTGANESSGIVGYVVQPGSNLRGSWGEYGVIAPGQVTGFASGAGVNFPSATIDQSTWSRLTFSNSPSYGSYGNASQLGTIPNIAGYDLDKLARDGTLVERSGNYTIGGMSNVTGTVVYSIGGRATISGDITYANTAASESNMPQVIIIANEIFIDPDVERVDAWLVATNRVDLCTGYGFTNNAATQLTTSRCNKQLVINGPILSKKLYLERTYNNNSGDPAEMVNLRSDAYIWAYNQAQKGAGYRTSYIRQLPPRY